MKEKEHNRYREEELEETAAEETTVKESKVEEATDEQVEDVSKSVEAEYQKMKDSYLRVLADFENFKKRTNEERARERKYINQSLFEKLINLFDVFDKAVNMKTEDDKIKNFLIGFQMINDSFKSLMEQEGVKKIEAVGKPFDPTYHHALEVEWDETKEENIVLAEMQTGYMYKDRLLRPSLVKVNQKQKGNENNE